MSRHFFAGANTPAGFFNHFGFILPFQNVERKIYIKGGSGTGKSTLMKKTAEFFEKRGFSAEYFHCSNDFESLDGISIRDVGIAVVDGTAPHPSDPHLPGAKEEIFNAADFLDKPYLRENRNELSEMLAEKKSLYERAYGYLSTAYEIYRLNERIYESAINPITLNEQIFETQRIFEGMKPISESGDLFKLYNRKLFATSITPEGIKSLVKSALKAEKTYILTGVCAMGISQMLDCLQRNANLLGLNTVSFKSPLNPSQTEHLYIPAQDAAFITSNNYHEYDGEGVEINFEVFLNEQMLRKSNGEINYNSGIFDELLQKSISIMAQSKQIHSKIEAIYSEGMDFKRMNRAFDRILEDLF
ncbi:MAG: hypothetical protein FWG70_02445 [Oscillospiraceae bacterium]|nr:hypothetical protein [Oscillospiraceae bacterium]